MTAQFAAELLQRIDSVECQMRQLETTLTHIREALHKECGLARTCNEAGVSLKELKRRELWADAENVL